MLKAEFVACHILHTAKHSSQPSIALSALVDVVDNIVGETEVVDRVVYNPFLGVINAVEHIEPVLCAYPYFAVETLNAAEIHVAGFGKGNLTDCVGARIVAVDVTVACSKDESTRDVFGHGCKLFVEQRCAAYVRDVVETAALGIEAIKSVYGRTHPHGHLGSDVEI